MARFPLCQPTPFRLYSSQGGSPAPLTPYHQESHNDPDPQHLQHLQHFWERNSPSRFRGMRGTRIRQRICVTDPRKYTPH